MEVLVGVRDERATHGRVARAIDDRPASSAVGARIYLHSPARRPYVASVLTPQAQVLADQFGADNVNLRSGWLGGPHFDLRAAAQPGQPIDWAAVAAALQAGAQGQPAPTMTEQDYLRQAADLGRIESVPPPYLPLRPHGHTEVLVAPDLATAGRLASLQERGRSLLLGPVLATAATEGEGALRARVAEAFLVLADCHPHGLRFGTFSFRSHAEAFFHWAGPRADYRSAFTMRMGKDRAVLEELVRRVLGGTERGPGAAWRRAFHACLGEFSGHVSEEDLDRAAPDDSASALRRPAGRSSFHAAVEASTVIDEPPEWFAAYRLTTNLFYQLLPVLDISPVQRFYLCHAVAESVDAVVGETWEARLAAVQSHLAAAR